MIDIFEKNIFGLTNNNILNRSMPDQKHHLGSVVRYAGHFHENLVPESNAGYSSLSLSKIVHFQLRGPIYLNHLEIIARNLLGFSFNLVLIDLQRGKTAKVMGFPMVGHFSSPIHCHASSGRVVLSSFPPTIVIRTPNSKPKYKILSGRNLVCKAGVMEFSDRTSPNEVLVSCRMINLINLILSFDGNFFFLIQIFYYTVNV